MGEPRAFLPVELGATQDLASLLCIASGFGLTVLSERFGWHTHGAPATRREQQRIHKDDK